MNLLKDNAYRIPLQQIEFLEKIPDNEMVLLYYLSLVEGMAFTEIVRANQEQKSAEEFKKIRELYLQKKYTDMEEVSGKVNQTIEQAKEAIEESKSLRELFTQNMQKIIEMQNQDGKEIIKSKEIIIEEKTKQIQFLTARLKETAESSVHSVEENRGKKHTDSFFMSMKKKRKSRKLLALYLANEQYSSEQKAFILDCIEDGDSLGDIEKFAMVGVSVEHMKRLKNTIEKYPS